MAGISTAADVKDILGISGSAVVVIGVPDFGAIASVADADAPVVDADPSSDCDAALFVVWSVKRFNMVHISPVLPSV